MTNMISWDPFNDLLSLGDSVNRNIAGFWQPSIDVAERPDSFVVRANLPGMDKDAIQLTVDDSSLIIKGESVENEISDGEHFYRRERRFGSFMRRVPFHGRIKADQARATFKNGVLEVLLPKTEDGNEKGLQIKIQ